MKQSQIDVTVKTNITGARPMGVNVKAMGHILSILSKMYSDPYLAMVREYASNALDSHADAGNPDPILITSPTHFEPKFVVQDFGTGLSEDEVLNVYAEYGTSTKSHSDDQIGHFGIGAKSAFAAVPQFIVTAVKDGMETVVLFSLDEKGAPTVNPMMHRETDEPNGVKVEIGVSDVDAINNAIDRLFRTWPKGTVLVDGVEPVSAWDDLSPITPDGDIHLGWDIERYSTENSWKVVMGGIAYDLPAAVIGSLEYRQRTIVDKIISSWAKVYITVPLGAVDITPSREDLMLTDVTTGALNHAIGKFQLFIGPWVTQQISGAKSQVEAIIKYNEINEKLGSLSNARDATWDGKPIPTAPIETHFDFFVLRHKRGDYGTFVARRDKDFRFGANRTLTKTLFVTDVPERKIRTVQLAAKEYLSQQDDGSMDKVSIVVAVTDPGYRKEWFDVADPAVRTMDFDTFAKFKPAQAASSGTRSAVRYNLAYGTSATAAELKQETTVYYLTHNEYLGVNEKSDLFRKAMGSSPLVVLKPTQKTEMLIKRVPQAASAMVAADKLAEKVLADVTKNDIDAITASNFLMHSDRNTVRFLALNSAKITNENVLSFLDNYSLAESLLADQVVQQRKSMILAAVNLLGKDRNSLGKSSWESREWDKLADGLPLMVRYFERSYGNTDLGKEHVIAYINMIGKS